MPRPVMATRRGGIRQTAGVAEPMDGSGGAAARSFLMPIYDVIDGFDRANIVVRDGNFEGVFQFEEQSKNVERIDAQILQIRIQRNFVGRNPLHGSQRRNYLVSNSIGHRALPSVELLNCKLCVKRDR